ncbi:MAG: hypothetical protein J6N19_01770 [Clostridium sp.]|nr:hypothetical protein [Clostridium sp.]
MRGACTEKDEYIPELRTECAAEETASAVGEEQHLLFRKGRYIGCGGKAHVTARGFDEIPVRAGMFRYVPGRSGRFREGVKPAEAGSVSCL